MALSGFPVATAVLRGRLAARVGQERSAALAVVLLGLVATTGPEAPLDAAAEVSLGRALNVLADPEAVLRADVAGHDPAGSDVAVTITAAWAGDRVVWLRSSTGVDRVEVDVTAAEGLVDDLATALEVLAVRRPAADAPASADRPRRSVIVQVAARHDGSTVVAGDAVAWFEDAAGGWQVDGTTGQLRPAGEGELRRAVAAALAAALSARTTRAASDDRLRAPREAR